MEAWKWMRFPSSASHFWKRGPLFQVANLRFFGGWTGTHGPTGVWLHTCSRNHVEFHFPTVFVLGSGRGRVADFPGKDVHYHPDTKWRVKTRKKIKWIQMISFKYIYIHTIFRGNLAVLTEQARHKKCHRYILTYMSEVKEAADPTL